MIKALKNSWVSVLSLLLVCVMILGVFTSTPAHAAGIDTLHYGYNYIGDMTITNNNTTPEKTIPGSTIQIGFRYKRASIDQGVGDIKITMKILDENYNQIGSGQAVTDATGYSYGGYESGYIPLQYAGQKIHIFFDVSSAGASNGHYRSAVIENFYINVL